MISESRDASMPEAASATIIENIRRIRQKVASDPVFAGDLRRLAIDAIRFGMEKDDGTPTPQWKELMSNYASDKTQLERLSGEDEAFENSDWGLACLAYIAGNSTCGIDTATMTGTERGFTPDMYDQMEEFEDNPTPNIYPVPECPE